jgi:hypothetical protein
VARASLRLVGMEELAGRHPHQVPALAGLFRLKAGLQPGNRRRLGHKPDAQARKGNSSALRGAGTRPGVDPDPLPAGSSLAAPPRITSWTLARARHGPWPGTSSARGASSPLLRGPHATAPLADRPAAAGPGPAPAARLRQAPGRAPRHHLEEDDPRHPCSAPASAS